MSSAAKKPTSQWPLRFQSPHNVPHLAKFAESVDWSVLTEDEKLAMYIREEELKEDPVNEEDEVKRRPRSYRFYRKKKTLVLENSSNDMHYEGCECSLDLAEMENSNPRTRKPEKKDEFRYVLLQFVKREGENGEPIPEINVLPVGNMFALRKTGGNREDETLDVIEEKFIQEKLQEKKRMSQYKHIYHALSKPGNNHSGDHDGQEEEENMDSFQFALGKAFTKKKGGHGGTGGGGGGKGGQEDDDGNNGNSNGNGNGMEGGLNENGIDLDAIKDYDNYCGSGGDYEVRFADDEEAHVEYEQQVNNIQEEEEISSAWRHDGEEEDDEDDEEEEDSDEEEEDAGALAEGLQSIEGSGGGSGSRGSSTKFTPSTSGLVNLSMLNSISKTKELVVQNQLQQQKHTEAYQRALHSNIVLTASNTNTNTNTNTSSSNKVLKSALKRSREDMTAAVDGSEMVEGGISSSGMEVTTATAVEDGTTTGGISSSNKDKKKKKVKLVLGEDTTGSASATNSSKTGTEFALSEEGVRSYMILRGGRVTTRDLYEVFKSKMKEYGLSVKDKKAGQVKFLDIVNRLTVTIEDPLLGDAIALKSSST